MPAQLGEWLYSSHVPAGKQEVVIVRQKGSGQNETVLDLNAPGHFASALGQVGP